LSRNFPIFIQLQLAYGLFAAKENFQMKERDDPILVKKKWMKNYEQKLLLEDFNTDTRLFKSGYLLFTRIILA
jgi:hypothetical protein